jgi:hypothetical protein
MEHSETQRYPGSSVWGLSIVYCLMILTPMVESGSSHSTVADFYRYYSDKLRLRLSTEMITLCFEDSVSADSKETLIGNDPVLKETSDHRLPYGLVLVSTKEGTDESQITETLRRLNTLRQVKYCTPVENSKTSQN